MTRDMWEATRNGPIGVFDSGIGGLSIVRELLRQIPNESLLYVADSSHCPFGARPQQEVLDLSMGITRYLLNHGAKLIVVACNTASAAALKQLREIFPEVPFVGMVPAVKPAAKQTRSGVVGVLATPITLHGELYEQVIEHYGRSVRVLSQACPGLVELVEAGHIDTPEMDAMLRALVEPLLAEGADTLVLGCTHYPFLIPALEKIGGPEVLIIEPSVAIAQQTLRVIEAQGLKRTNGSAPKHWFGTSGDLTHLQRSLRQLLNIETQHTRQLRWKGITLIEDLV